MTPQDSSANSRTRLILEDLESVRENLFAFSDDIWLDIDRQDLTAYDEGVQFMRAYLEKMVEFDQVASGISVLIQQYTSVRLDESEKTGGDDQANNERIIAELNRDEPHSLDENFTWKRPCGFIFNGQAVTGLLTWQRMFELVCQQLFARDPERFYSLSTHTDFISNRGNQTVTNDRHSLRKPLSITNDLYIESNFSANSIRDMLYLTRR